MREMDGWYVEERLALAFVSRATVCDRAGGLVDVTDSLAEALSLAQEFF